ncbi:PQQ-dependent sugar dehydrogenase [Bdellovibrio reynosensis]|uniref:PQQ-dependent sugar dehydrogenase n=1 Tax=Bdellovibrio reynosensis TaxID=2835041 RepID=A0ABY4CBV5_9BACT|nr:PQQ-dependent sugar dehydrogenase [Bdellovibrio reynosensis]UOF02199.1 PQQ-dependent sugar dehydrogenase [Bdellovibrio reynosensis]
MIKILLALIAVVVLVACRDDDTNSLNPPLTQKPGVPVATPDFSRTDFMRDLDDPWDMAFTLDSTMFFTEKCRGLSVRTPDGKVTKLFGGNGYNTFVPDFFCAGQSGMHGVAIDPNFASNRRIYVFMPSELSSPRTNRIVRLVVDANFTSVSERTDIITDISFKDRRNLWGGVGTHSGGRIRFGPDGYLYITTGDNHNGPLPQDLTKLGGKILRVDTNGKAAPGNNTPTGGDPRIYVYGLRNAQGLTFKPSNGRPFIAEHGPNHSDEVTALSPGGNGGWDPKPDSGVSCADNYCGYISNRKDGKLTSMTDTDKFPQALKPLFVMPDSQGMGTAAFVVGQQWKDWNGILLVSLMASEKLIALKVNDQDGLSSITPVNVPSERIRSIVQGPDSNIYMALDDGTIWKFTPK